MTGVSPARYHESTVALTPVQARTAATAAPAEQFGLTDHGRITPVMTADLVIVDGDPTKDIAATLNIRRIWRRGTPITRSLNA